MNKENTLNTMPTWVRIVGWVALFWNLIGVVAYISLVTMSPEVINCLPLAQKELIENTPAWPTAAYAFAVFGGLAGSILLLLKMKAAFPLFIISLVGIFTQLYHALFMANALEVYGPGGAVMPIMILLFAIVLVWLSRKALKNRWVN